jgi:hypothetical protein
MNNKQNVGLVEGMGLPMKKLGRLLALVAPLFLLAIPYYEAKANWIQGFNCFGETYCVNGWNVGVNQAETDWNGGFYNHLLNGGDLNCFSAYTDSECHGYIHGYIYEWTQLWQQGHAGGDNR